MSCAVPHYITLARRVLLYPPPLEHTWPYSPHSRVCFHRPFILETRVLLLAVKLFLPPQLKCAVFSGGGGGADTVYQRLPESLWEKELHNSAGIYFHLTSFPSEPERIQPQTFQSKRRPLKEWKSCFRSCRASMESKPSEGRRTCELSQLNDGRTIS